MRRCAFPAAAVALLAATAQAEPAPPAGRTFYVRQTVGDDTRDGLTPATAWRTLEHVGRRVEAGDLAYVGPGLYRDSVNVEHAGRADARIAFVADPSGAHTGDPPGPVLVAGSEPVDETRFLPTSEPGVFELPFPEFAVLGVVEMDGPQARYRGVLEPVVGPPPLERVRSTPATFYYDTSAKTLTIHTSDGRTPASHELELIRRHTAFFVVRQPWVTVVGFALRHFSDTGISFRWAAHGAAVGNLSWGSRQGIRVRESEDVVLEGNTLLRNENSGAYFVSGAHGGVAIRNVAYENVKGLRWSSESRGGLALDNVLFENLEAGLSLERAAGAFARGNLLARNARSQLMLHLAAPRSEANCFEVSAGASTAEYWGGARFATLAAWQQASGLDLGSRQGRCGALPEKADVAKLHAESLGYRERALRKLGLAGDRPR
jgi:parallel beta-helix repeat protein